MNIKRIIPLLLLLITNSIFAIDNDSITTKKLESVNIIGIRTTQREPTTLTRIKIDSIRQVLTGEDPFFILNKLNPNTLSQSDCGLPVGYSYIRIRGLDQTKINFTINGIPLNEMEDQGIYFSNMPDFMSNIGEIEVQRGVGTSKYGTTSFGSSINLETNSIINPEVTGEVGMGSFNTFKTSYGFTTGLLKDKFSFSSRFSHLTSDGFRYNSYTKGYTYFGQAGYFTKNNIIKVYGFSGQSSNGMAWLAPTKYDIDKDYRTNLNTSEEKDKFNQNFISLNWINFKLNNIKFNSSIYFNNINGNYTSYIGSPLGSFYLNSYQSGLVYNMIYNKNNLNINTGINYNYYQRKHRLYEILNTKENIGYKQDFTAYAKFILLDKNVKGLNFFLDIQYRWVKFDYDHKLKKDWNFVNPKVGIKYIHNKWESYLSFSTTGRESTRSDILHGYDNVDVINNNQVYFSSDTFTINTNPERCYDIEIGGSYKYKGLTLKGNYYFMYFNNERIFNGVINSIGLPLRNVVDESSRMGFEVEGNYTFKGLTIGSNLSVSKNKIYNWSDNNGKIYKNTEPSNTPRLLFNNTIQYRHKYFLIGLNGQYVSSMYLDNTENNNLTTKKYYLLNANVGLMYKFLSLTANLNNITNQKYYLPGGVSNNQPAYYTGSLFNFFINLKVKI